MTPDERSRSSTRFAHFQPSTAAAADPRLERPSARSGSSRARCGPARLRKATATGLPASTVSATASGRRGGAACHQPHGHAQAESVAAASARACASTGGAAAFGTPETLESVPANTRAPSQPARTRPAHACTAGAQLADAQARSHAPVGAEGAAPAARGAAAHGMPSGAEAASAGPTPSSSPSSPAAASTPISRPVLLEALARGRRARAAAAAVRQAPESVGRLARAAAAATATSRHPGQPNKRWERF